MSRDIKFRAWDSYNKVMINPFCELKDNRFWGEDCTNTGYAPSDIMQYTGLKDKTGKEIYEGDIVEIIDHTSRKNPFIAEVYYDTNVASFSGKVNNYPIDLFLHNPIKKSDWIPEMKPFIQIERTIEVIGNIYENPELLK